MRYMARLSLTFPNEVLKNSYACIILSFFFLRAGGPLS